MDMEDWILSQKYSYIPVTLSEDGARTSHFFWVVHETDILDLHVVRVPRNTACGFG